MNRLVFFFCLGAVLILPQLNYAQLELTIDRSTGQAVFENPGAAAIPLDGYAITSANGLLSPATWSGFQDQLLAGWEEAANASALQLAELNSSSNLSIPAGTVGNSGPSIGNVFSDSDSAAVELAMTNAGFGEAHEDVAFQYSAGGSLVNGTVNYIGELRYNNLVLEVNTATGAVQIVNESPLSVEIDAIEILSAGSALSTSWNGLGDTNTDWEMAGTNSAMGLAEFQPTGSLVFAEESSEDIGSAFVVGGAQDLTFAFHRRGDVDAFAGIVRYVSGGGGLLCDLDSDGDCDQTDIDVLYGTSPSPTDIDDWLSQASDPANPYKTASGGTVNDVYMMGDANLDGNVDSIDLGSLLNNFNSTAGVTWDGGDLNADGNVDSIDLGLLLNQFGFTSAAASAVPEPSTMALLLMSVLGALLTARHSTSRGGRGAS